MEKIKINYIDTPSRIVNNIIFDEKMNFINERLSQYYKVEITNKDPDIVFCDLYGIEFAKYNCIRCGVCVEEYAPNFNIYDYVITIFDDFMFKGRVHCLKAPIILNAGRENLAMALKKHENCNGILEEKTDFCSFVQSRGTGVDNSRTDIFNKLSLYKKINSGGALYNNIGNFVKNKLEFEKKHKFSISFTNGKNYTLQDRPLDAFAAQTVPIYWGNPDIGKVYNTKAFINCHDFENFDEVVEFVKKIDNNNDQYMEMLKTPAFVEPTSIEGELEKFDQFLINIVENGTIQRSGVYWNRVFEKEIYYGRKKYTKTTRWANKLKPLTKVVFASKIGSKIKKKILSHTFKRELHNAYKTIK